MFCRYSDILSDVIKCNFYSILIWGKYNKTKIIINILIIFGVYINMKHFYKYLLFSFIIIVVSSCYYDNEEELYIKDVVSNCDTANVSFSKDIYPIFLGHCNACHDNNNAPVLGGGIALENYSDIKSAADDSSLYGSVSYNAEYVFMPEDYQLDSCSLLKIKAWIEKGAKND